MTQRRHDDGPRCHDDGSVVVTVRCLEVNDELINLSHRHLGFINRLHHHHRHTSVIQSDTSQIHQCSSPHTAQRLTCMNRYNKHSTVADSSVENLLSPEQN